MKWEKQRDFRYSITGKYCFTVYIWSSGADMFFDHVMTIMFVRKLKIVSEYRLDDFPRTLSLPRTANLWFRIESLCL